LINEKEINNYLLSLKRKKVSSGIINEDDSINQMADVNEDTFRNRNEAELKFDSLSEIDDDYATSLLRANLSKLAKSDYVLLFILIVIIVITSILFAFIAVVCIYNRYKKQYKGSREAAGNKRARQREKQSKSKINFDVDKRLNEDEDMMNEHLSTTSSSASSSVNEKKKLSKASNRKIYFNDLNVSTSSTSSTSHSTDLSSNHNGKHHNAHSTQYTLITNSATSNGTLIFRDIQDEIEEGENMMMMVTAPVGTFRRAQAQQSQPIYSTVNKGTLSNKQPKFTNLGLSLSRNGGYESSNRSNSGSGVESIGMDTMTTGEDSSKQSSHHTSPNSSSHQIDTSSSSSSSSSSNPLVKHQKSNESKHVNKNSAHTIICYDDQTKQPQHFMSFKKGPMFNTNNLTAPMTPSTYAKTLNYNSQHSANAGLGRTSFDL
jgi:hypothetical protein